MMPDAFSIAVQSDFYHNIKPDLLLCHFSFLSIRRCEDFLILFNWLLFVHWPNLLPIRSYEKKKTGERESTKTSVSLMS
jgi:hypothetical protein